MRFLHLREHLFIRISNFSFLSVMGKQLSSQRDLIYVDQAQYTSKKIKLLVPEATLRRSGGGTAPRFLTNTHIGHGKAVNYSVVVVVYSGPLIECMLPTTGATLYSALLSSI